MMGEGMQFVLTCFFTLTLGNHHSLPSTYINECFVWHNASEYIEHQPNVAVECAKNQQCTGLDCSGVYSYHGLIPTLTDFKEDVCFGMNINPCESPLGLQFYVIVPGMANFTTTVYEDQTIQLKGVHQEVIPGSGYNLDGFIDVEIENVSIPRQPDRKYVRLGMKYKMRLKGSFIESYPDGARFTLIPDLVIPVPDCIPHIHGNITLPSQCLPGAEPAPWLPPQTFTTSSPGKPCIVEFGSCDQHQTCLVMSENGTEGHCACLYGYMDDHTNTELTCIQQGSTPSPTEYFIDYPRAPESGMSSKKKNILYIVFGAVGVAAVMAIILVIAVVKYKRYQARYGNHTMLADADDDDDLQSPLTSAVDMNDDVPPILL